MDRSRALAQLQQAEGHVAEGEAHIRRQREIIVWLENRGHDAALAKDLLATFETMQTHHVTERERLRKEKSTYLGAYVFGERAREHLARAEEALERRALHLDAVQVQLGIVRDIIAECRYGLELVEDVLKALCLLRRANAEAVLEGEEAADEANGAPEP